MDKELYKIENQKIKKREFENMLGQYKFPSSISSFFLTVRSSDSQKSYWNVMKDFFIWKFKDLYDIKTEDMKDLNYIDIKCYLDHIVETKDLSQATINQRVAILSAFCKHLYGIGVQEKNIMNFVNTKTYKKKVHKSRVKTEKMPTNHDVAAMKKRIEKIKNPIRRERNMLIFNMLKTLGLRLTELVGLDLGHLHLDDEIPYLEVLRKGSYTENQLEMVKLPLKLVSNIKEWIILRSLIDGYDKTNALFVMDGGLRISHRTIQDMFKKYSDNEITPHMLRHYALTMMLKTTKDLAFVREQAGHAWGSEVTMGIYVSGLEDSLIKYKNM